MLLARFQMEQHAEWTDKLCPSGQSIRWLQSAMHLLLASSMVCGEHG
jgi:hypothetical protein